MATDLTLDGDAKSMHSLHWATWDMELVNMNVTAVSNLVRKRFSLAASAMIVSILVMANLQLALGQGGSGRTPLTPLQMVQSGRNVEALPYFKAMAKNTPRDPSVNYYLGVCAESARDLDLAEMAFCRVVVATKPESPFVPLAQKRLQVLPHHLQPQCCLYKDETRLWDRSAYPLRVFVTNGRTLPKHLAGGPTTPAEYKSIIATIQTNLAAMPVAPDYQPAFARLVVEGLQAWDWAVREKLFSYTYVRDARLADIVILFCEQRTGYTHFPYEKGQPMVTWIAVNEESGQANTFGRNCVRDMSAHEFGHCLGLGHSTVDLDVMFPITNIASQEDRQTASTITSDNDRASLRALFSMPADRILYSVK